MHEDITFSEIFAFLLMLGRDDLVVDISPNAMEYDSSTERDEANPIDEKFVRSHGEKIAEALSEMIDALAERDADEAFNLMVSSMQMLTRISNNANKSSMGHVGNLVFKKISKWKAVADKIKFKLGAKGYTIGASLGLRV